MLGTESEFIIIIVNYYYCELCAVKDLARNLP